MLSTSVKPPLHRANLKTVVSRLEGYKWKTAQLNRFREEIETLPNYLARARYKKSAHI